MSTCIKVYIVNNFVMRTVKTRNGDFVPMWCASAISDGKKILSVASFDEKRIERFGKGDYLCLKNYKELTLEDATISITLSAQSNVCSFIHSSRNIIILVDTVLCRMFIFITPISFFVPILCRPAYITHF